MKQHASPYAYIRRSVTSRNNPGDVSREFQTEEVRRLAGDEVSRLTVIDQDWGKSAAADKTAQRLGFLDLLERVERGEVTTLYAYSTDRLARSVRWSAQLLDACEAAGTVIVTGEGRFAPDDDLARSMFHFAAVQNEAALRAMEKKAKATTARRRARGDALGIAPYGWRLVHGRKERNPDEPIEPIEAAFGEAGSYFGAARILNERGVRTRRNAEWTGRVVGHVLQREGIVSPHKRMPGAKQTAGWALYRLVRCHCGHTMTPMDRRTPRLTCYKARQSPDHAKPFGIAENKVLPFVQAAVDALSMPEVVTQTARVTSERDQLTAERERLVLLFSKGKIDEAAFDRLVEPVDVALERVEEQEQIHDVPQIDWSWPAADVNRLLRLLIDHVELGPDLRPTGIAWRGRIAEWAE